MTWSSRRSISGSPASIVVSPRKVGSKSRTMSSGSTSTAANTTCHKGHDHPPWPTSGILRIAKCESVCGFCQKETKTAANLRKVSVSVPRSVHWTSADLSQSTSPYILRMKASISPSLKVQVGVADCEYYHDIFCEIKV